MRSFLVLGNRTITRLMLKISRARKGVVIRAGFGIIIALLIFSSIQANRIQDSTSRQSFEVYQRYNKQQDVLSEFRRNLLMGTIYARDFFLSPWADRADVLHSEIEHLKIDTAGALDEIDRMPGLRASLPALRSATKEFLDTLGRVPDESRPDRTFEVVDREITERRLAATRILENLIETNQNALQRSDAEFSESRRKATSRLFLMLGLCLLLGLAVALFSIIYAETLEEMSAQRYEDVIQAKLDLQRLSVRILQIQEEERRRLSRELHDEIGQSLTALRMDISQAVAVAKERAPEIHGRLEHARQIAEKTTQAVRDISLLLRPSLLDDLGLVPALEWQVEEFTRRTGIACELVNDGLTPRLPDSSATGVYRIVQETLHNCEKHSGAQNVRVLLRQSQRVLTVEIHDDGCGFKVGEKDAKGKGRRPAGLGLLGMRERAESIGGRLNVESEPGKGTQVTLRVPLPESELLERVASTHEAGV